jgi:RND family efflux transporter MFP subunit
MAVLRNRRVVIALAAAVVLSVAWALVRDTGATDAVILAPVERGEFTVTVTTSGELNARESVKINAPTSARDARIYQLMIETIVPEGTLVDSGDMVAELDRSQAATRMSEVTLALEKAQAVFEQAMLDTTLTLSQAREAIRTMEFELEEQRIAKEQSVYEAPSVRRQAEIAYEKAERTLAQARTDYVTKEEQARAKMREVGADLGRERSQLEVVQRVMAGLTVRAPTPGMVIYVKEWNGRKKVAGSQVSPWDPAVATLPDLTQMESVTFVNEIDIRKIQTGQPVSITLDSDPDKRLTGTVTAVANIGEQRPNTDAKVFEVHIEIAGSDTTLRPGMTTGNAIETAAYDDVLSIPIEALASDDGIPCVYLQVGGSVRKQEVVTGPMNENHVIVERGLDEDDRVYLLPPSNAADLNIVRLPDSPVPPPGEADSAAGSDTAGSSDAQPKDDGTDRP